MDDPLEMWARVLEKRLKYATPEEREVMRDEIRMLRSDYNHYAPKPESAYYSYEDYYRANSLDALPPDEFVPKGKMNHESINVGEFFDGTGFIYFAIFVIPVTLLALTLVGSCLCKL